MKVLLLVVMAVVAVVLLFGWVFPWLDGFITYADPSIGATSS